MVRARDRRGRYIFVDRTPKDIFGPQRVPHTNFFDHYIGSTSRRGRESAPHPELQTSQIVEQREEQLQEETEQHISPSIDQEVDPETIHQFLNKATSPVLCQVDLETVVDNFEKNLVKEPSGSSWDTTPAASTIKFFGGMADHEVHRRDF